MTLSTSHGDSVPIHPGVPSRRKIGLEEVFPRWQKQRREPLAVDTMSGSDALLWTISSDPVMRPTIVALMVLNGKPDWAAVRARVAELTEAVPRLRSRAVARPLGLGDLSSCQTRPLPWTRIFGGCGYLNTGIYGMSWTWLRRWPRVGSMLPCRCGKPSSSRSRTSIVPSSS